MAKKFYRTGSASKNSLGLIGSRNIKKEAQLEEEFLKPVLSWDTYLMDLRLYDLGLTVWYLFQATQIS